VETTKVILKNIPFRQIIGVYYTITINIRDISTNRHDISVRSHWDRGNVALTDDVAAL